MTGARRAVFLDRDGTLIEERHYLSDPAQVELLPGVVAALRDLRDAGWPLVLVTNQSGIARGLFPPEALPPIHARLTALLSEAGVDLAGVYHCPHHPDGSVAEFATACDCRKPRPGLLLRAESELGLTLPGSWVVGDKRSDLLLGRELGLRSILVRTGYGRATEETDGGLAAHVADDLSDAAKFILRERGGTP